MRYKTGKTELVGCIGDCSCPPRFYNTLTLSEPIQCPVSTGNGFVQFLLNKYEKSWQRRLGKRKAYHILELR